MTSTRARQAIQHSESMAQPIFDKKKKTNVPQINKTKKRKRQQKRIRLYVFPPSNKMPRTPDETSFKNNMHRNDRPGCSANTP